MCVCMCVCVCAGWSRDTVCTAVPGLMQVWYHFTQTPPHTHSLSAQEGEAFLESQGMAVSSDDVKTRAQKEKLEEIEAEAEKPKVTRAGTMAVTAEVRGGERV